MDRQIRRMAVALLGLFLLLLAQVNYIQVFAADELANNPANRRLIIQEYEVDRGDILARDARTVLARSVTSRGELRFLRRYPDPHLYAGITGYYSVVFGRSELEQSYNDYLSGRAPALFPTNLVDELLGRPKRGATVITTIDPRLQEVARDALGDRPGAVAAVDPATGEVLVLVSVPSFNPNPLSSHDPATARDAWRALQDAPGQPLLANANDLFYPPGSTFKILTAAAALENGLGPDSEWDNPPELDLPQTESTITNAGGGTCPGGGERVTLARAFQYSCNVIFGEIGLELGGERLAEQSEAFGFEQDVPFDIPFREGQFSTLDSFENDQPAVARSAIGLQDVRANPLHMALVGAAIANDGVLMRPQLVREVRGPQGLVIDEMDPEEWGRPISSETASILTELMESVVEAGTGTAARIPGIPVAGKTGTARYSNEAPPHVWFVAFAPADQPRIAVAVVVLNGGGFGDEASGGRVAAPIARAVIEAYLGTGG
ncbi:MAG: penicillin-binding protein 2 [Actinobacteria bacterium]|nr:penicillin-binding protein 2 [Actinomycetota bacterium]